MAPSSTALVFTSTCRASGESHTVDLLDTVPLEAKFTPAQILAMTVNQPRAN